MAGGAVSGWLVHEVRAGDVIEVQAPSGSFTPDLRAPGQHVLIAAGSGITPVLSIAASVLAAHAESSVTLLYGNRRSDSVMFADEIADLKDSYPARICAGPRAQPRAAGSGPVQRPARRREAAVAAAGHGRRAAVDHWWLCGPFAMVKGAIGVLGELGVTRDRIHRELFYVEDAPPEQAKHADAPAGRAPR